MPHHACDPIPIACEIVTAIQAMVTRRVDVFDPAVVTVAKIRAGTTSNVIPETAQLLGTIRTVSERTRTAVLDDLRRLAEGIAAAHGAEAEVPIGRGLPGHRERRRRRRRSPSTPPAAARRRPGGRDAVAGDGRRGLVLRAPAGARGDGVPRHAPGRERARVAPNHSNRMVIDEDAMAAGIATYAGVALRWLAEAPSR